MTEANAASEAVTETQATPAQPQNDVAPTPASAEGDVVSRMFERDVVIQLDDKKIADLAVKASAIDKERSDLDAEMKKVVADYKDRINKKLASVAAILEEIRVGETTQLMQVKEVRDYNLATVTLFIGANYDQKIEERAMQGDELQKDLFLRKPDSEADDSDESDINPDLPISTETDADADLAEAMREEISGKTKRSSVDGPVS